MNPKFRVWHKDGKVMLSNYLGFMITDAGQLLIESMLGDETTMEKVELDNYIVMQCTGLKDKNGVEIYEGDIVKGQITLGYKRTGVIKLDTDAFCFVEFWKEGMLTMFEENPDRMIIYNGFGGYEVIGNIYENPELLEEKE